MSFAKASAIVRGKWLIDKQWAGAHMPLVISFMKGDAKAGSMLMGDDDMMNEEDDSPEKIAQNVYEINCDTDLTEVPYCSVVLVDVDGPMFKAGDMCSDGMEDYAELFSSIAQASNITGVILDLDSPGGQVDGTATFAAAVKACAAVKPVIGYVNDGLCASAAYWVLSACTEIYCSQPTDAVGSIGVYCTIADWNAYYAAEGLPIKDVYAPESTDKNIEYRESIAGNDELLQADLSVIAKAFISAVKTNRKGKIKGSNWATGKMFFAADAIAEGLIDGIKSFDQIVLKLSRTAKTIKNSNNMAFEKTLTVAAVDAFEVVDGGFLLGEEALNNIEANLISSAEFNFKINQVSQKNDSLNTQIDALINTAVKDSATIRTQSARIVELEAKVAELGGKPSGNGSVLISKKDEVAGDKAATPSYLDDNDPINQFADSKMRKRK